MASSYCFSNDDPSSAFQLWDIVDGAFEDKTIPLVANRTNLVLDAMPDGGLRLNEIGINPTGQSWTKTETGGLTIGDNKCLAVDADSDPECKLPWGSVVDLEVEDCDENVLSQVSIANVNQVRILTIVLLCSGPQPRFRPQQDRTPFVNVFAEHATRTLIPYDAFAMHVLLTERNVFIINIST